MGGAASTNARFERIDDQCSGEYGVCVGNDICNMLTCVRSDMGSALSLSKKFENDREIVGEGLAPPLQKNPQNYHNIFHM